ncbi:hypothetical protein CARUB_v10002840mg [Capsella rubella]|uniref:Uncharacterized protein n=1 Tax=Capsella rubella TaxID=81985 RepID=R0FJH0_9BRAS|nr:kinesin-1 heavy chain [Capsella rubella]EOA22251.1 hypothetical protein CARUB_v10002840mg [Capsella rubella]
MSRLRAFSAPDLVPSDSGSITSSPTKTTEHPCHEDSGLEGITTNVKLLLKLVQDHNEATSRQHDDWKVQRVKTMMTILDDLKARIQKAQQQSSSGKKELRRCNTELRPIHDPSKNPTKPPQNDPDDIQKLRRELTASMAARKSLQMMCSSLGKEKEIMALELSRKAHELTEMEELISDLRAQNNKLLKKVQNCAVEHNKEKKEDDDGQGCKDASLQGRNKELSEQLLKSIDGYRSLKRKYKEVQEENGSMRRALRDYAEEVNDGTQRLTKLHEKITREDEVNLENEISDLENLLQGLGLKISNHSQKK